MCNIEPILPLFNNPVHDFFVGIRLRVLELSSIFPEFPRNLGIGRLAPLRGKVMGSKGRSISNSSSIAGQNFDRKLKETVDNDNPISNSPLLKVDVNLVELQDIKDDPGKIEAMTVQQLRTALRTAGISSKGLKRELVCALQSYLAEEMDGESSLLAEKLDPSDSDKKISMMMETKSVEDQVQGRKTSLTKRKRPIEVDCKAVSAENGVTPVNQSEPWTILAHKKPQKEWIAYNPRTMRRTPPTEKDVESIKQSLIEGYENSFWTCSNAKLGYSGTAIISRIKPLSVRYGLGISDHDSEGRVVTAEFDSFYLLSVYVPNSGDGLRRLTYRTTEWDPSLSNYIKELEKSKPVILTGDLNCAHEEIDIYNPAGNRRSAGFTIEERQSFGTNFLSRGFVDTFRKQHPGVVGYTYWGYRHGGRKTNKGWRLDYFLVSEAIADAVHDSYILPDVVGSDHCPIGLVLKL
ncbi:hypothetical protein V6N13_148601 [Hibiscus sabdariffa]